MNIEIFWKVDSAELYIVFDTALCGVPTRLGPSFLYQM